jgi:hypothetical protein
MDKPLRLSDAQQSTIIRAAWALDPAAREILRERVLERLQAEHEIGDGVTFRICRSIQRTLFVPPKDDGGYRNSPRPLSRLR